MLTNIVSFAYIIIHSEQIDMLRFEHSAHMCSHSNSIAVDIVAIELRRLTELQFRSHI